MTTPKGWPKKTEVSMVPGINESYWVKRINEMRDLCLTVHNALMAEKECEYKKVFMQKELYSERIKILEKELKQTKEKFLEKVKSSKKFIENDSTYINSLLKEIERLKRVPTENEIDALMWHYAPIRNPRMCAQAILNLIEERRK